MSIKDLTLQSFRRQLDIQPASPHPILVWRPLMSRARMFCLKSHQLRSVRVAMSDTLGVARSTTSTTTPTPDGLSAPPVYSLQSGLIFWPDRIPPQYTTVHLHCSISRVVSQDLAEMPAEERRLAAEEGSYSLKTWLLKTEDQEAG